MTPEFARIIINEVENSKYKGQPEELKRE